MIRKMLIAVLALLVVLVIAADRVGASVADHVLAGKLQTDEHLSSRPSVSIGGIPFLTQAIHGRYGDIKVVAHDFKTPDQVEIDTLTAHLHGVHIPLSKVIGGSVSKVPVNHVDGTAFVSFSEITSYLTGTGVSLTIHRAGAGTVSVVGHAVGRSRLLKGVATVSVKAGVITLTLVNDVTGTHLVLPIPLHGLPFRVEVTSVTVGADGITGTGTAEHVTLGS